MQTWNEKIPFLETLKQNEELMQLISEKEIEELFTYEEIFKSVDYIYNRLGL